MNGAHDLGGKHGFGPVDRSQTEDFVHTWEEQVFSLTLACGMLGQWNLDQSRYARECTDPVSYLSGSYYEHWLHGLELLLVQKGLVSKDELTHGQNNEQETPGLTAANPDTVKKILNTGTSTLMPDTAANKFTLHQRVIVKKQNPKSHTRAPSYIHGVAGTVIKLHGMHVFADEHAASGKKVPQHLYTVRFEAQSIWGGDAEPNSCVYVDLFEPYLLAPD